MNQPPFIQWAEKEHIIQTLPLRELANRTLGIDASYFLRTLGPEGVLSALGGSPISLGARISTLVKKLRDDAGLSLHFVFDGLHYGGGRDEAFAVAERSARMVEEGYRSYGGPNSQDANRIFKHAAPQNPTLITRTFQKTLHDLKVPFSVAPYSALAQLAYYERDPRQFLSAVYGPPELFCFGVEKLVHRFSFPQSENSSNHEPNGVAHPEPSFSYIDRRLALERLGNISPNVLKQAVLLSGSSLLPIYPNLRKTDPSVSMREAVDAINAAGGDARRLCAQIIEPEARSTYLDQHKRATAGLRHHIVITAEGDLVPLGKEHAPSDVHEFMGLRLPEELYLYLSRGVIQPEVLDWLTSGQINITTPAVGGESVAAQKLASTGLDPLRRQALTLLAEPIHRYYQTKDISTKLWFDRDNDIKFTSRNIQPSPREMLSKWNVKASLLAEANSASSPPGTFGFALRSLSNAEFAAKTITPKSKSHADAMKTPTEVAANAIWRLLHLRGYVSDQHRLTLWGKILEKALTGVGASTELQEAVFIAVELLRLDVLNESAMFPDYEGAPTNGSARDQRHCLLVSGVASLGKLRHREQPYSGPLSKRLTAYQAMASSVRRTLRDLLEMNVAAMLLDGGVDRDQQDWMALSLALPFYDEHSCALGVLTLHYLNEVSDSETPQSKETHQEVRERIKGWVSGAQCDESLKDAFMLWDTVYGAVCMAGDSGEVKDRTQWDEANEWVLQRR